MQIGVDSFVAATVDAAGRAIDPAKNISELLEAITLADEVGLDVFGSVNITGASSLIPRRP